MNIKSSIKLYPMISSDSLSPLYAFVTIYECLLILQADIVVLTTSEENGLCYIETAELDG